MIAKTNIFRIIGATLLLAGFIGVFVASPEPVRIIPLEDGSATAVPRIAWAAGCAEVSLLLGLGFLIAPSIFKGR